MRIHPDLLKQLGKKLKVSDSRVYELIGKVANERKLPRYLAAISLGADSGININRFASDDDLAILRQAPNLPPPIEPTRVPIALSSPTRLTPKKTATKLTKEKRRGTSVFVVHGRDEKATRSLFSFLRAVGLDPVEWNKAIAKTKKGSPYVGDILDAAFGQAVAVVVLLTPDDVAKLKKEFLKATDPAHERELTGQARANVLFEAGMAFGKNPNSTVLVQVGQLRPFSDVGGRHVVHLSNSPESRQELVTKLANAGCNVDATGTHWLSEGDFSAHPPVRKTRN
jgi:predicted nucleotide-binding protein